MVPSLSSVANVAFCSTVNAVVGAPVIEPVSVICSESFVPATLMLVNAESITVPETAKAWVVSSPCAAVEATSKEISWLRYFFFMVSRHKVAIVVKMQMR
ncbi:hypothetical protein D3C80_1167290 [compost metagenome]